MPLFNSRGTLLILINGCVKLVAKHYDGHLNNAYNAPLTFVYNKLYI